MLVNEMQMEPDIKKHTAKDRRDFSKGNGTVGLATGIQQWAQRGDCHIGERNQLLNPLQRSELHQDNNQKAEEQQKADTMGSISQRPAGKRSVLRDRKQPRPEKCRQV